MGMRVLIWSIEYQQPPISTAHFKKETARIHKDQTSLYIAILYIFISPIFPFSHMLFYFSRDVLKISAHSSNQQGDFLGDTGVVDSKFPKHPVPVSSFKQKNKHLPTSQLLSFFFSLLSLCFALSSLYRNASLG